MKLTVSLSALLALQILASPLPSSVKGRDDLTAYVAANVAGELSEKRDDLTEYVAANVAGEVSVKERNNLAVYGAAAQKTHETLTARDELTAYVAANVAGEVDAGS